MKNRKNKPVKKVIKYKEIPPESTDSSGILELLPRFELGTSSLPILPRVCFLVISCFVLVPGTVAAQWFSAIFLLQFHVP